MRGLNPWKSEAWFGRFQFKEQQKSRGNASTHDTEEAKDAEEASLPWTPKMNGNREESGTISIQQDGKSPSTKSHREKWYTRYRELEAFKAEHGHCNVPQRQGALGKWVHNQRTERKNDKLSEKRVQKLDGLGFVWKPRSSPMTWDERLAELTRYKDAHGDCRVPRSHGPLCHWVKGQRAARKKDKLSEERIRKLDNLGFEWSNTCQWDERLDELTSYMEEHGNCDVPQGQGALGTWVHNQRQRKGNLTNERVQQLDNLGFNWGRISHGWDERLDDLIEYKAEHGHCNVPQGQGTLGIWVHNQRLRKRQLSEERLKKLDDLNFNWGKSSKCRGKKKTKRIEAENV
ncbi:hypothetical protein THAOC_33510 [Thalassiosira oceanica]|uniref:Helicase-associated domain-containing protein n=1 Tax=Thalassiosira oceanica TaxID=159749 RepID=K0RM11_THAOC|nr:hypothetical protein THAOC_33510 [Thalassiosira oceanica]|eukprot:EJK47752.1 hypothetical protein THAOC_33510 [Thalassiosira oceanica]